MSHIHEITERNFEAEVAASDVPVLLDFTAPWCSPCRVLAPIVHKVAAERAGRLKVGVVDNDENQALATRFGVRGLPTLVLVVRGKEVARHLGVTTREKLLAMVDACARPEVVRA